MDKRQFDSVLSLEEINNLEGPYIEITTETSNYNLKIKKTFIPNVIIINNKVCDFNKSEGYWFSDNIIIFIINKKIFFGR